jgi:hypothetical protein
MDGVRACRDVLGANALADLAAGEQWIVWRENDLASETEWATAELIALAALPGGAAARLPSADERLPPGRTWGGVSHGVARRLDRMLLLCEQEIEVVRRRLAALARSGPD